MERSDLYEIMANYPLDMLDYQVIHMLYKPLIGKEAVNVYTTLWSEINQMVLTSASASFERLIKISGESLNEIENSFLKLEGIGLLNRYVKNEHMYVLELLLPLSPGKFVKHQVLNTLLYSTLGNDDYNRTLLNFKTAKKELNDYKDITSSFEDVYSINFDRPVVLLSDVKEKEIRNIEENYDLKIVEDKLEEYGYHKEVLTALQWKKVAETGLLYDIAETVMASIVQESIVDYMFKEAIFINKCRNEYDLRQPQKLEKINHTTAIKDKSITGNDQLSKHIQYLESISPYQLLKDKMGGAEPLKSDLITIESVLSLLNPGVTNVLIEYTLAYCNNRLPKRFMETIGSSWKRKGITTVKDAIDEAKKKKETESTSWTYKEDHTSENDDVDDDSWKKAIEMFG